jgi:KaiC/GvpD/RAD55 family RecA-like ATPase
MMQTLKIAVDWLDALLPEGLPLDTSTLLSGPDGSGKPLQRT